MDGVGMEDLEVRWMLGRPLSGQVVRECPLPPPPGPSGLGSGWESGHVLDHRLNNIFSSQSVQVTLLGNIGGSGCGFKDQTARMAPVY